MLNNPELFGGLASLAVVGLEIGQTPPKVGSRDLVADPFRLMRLTNLSLQDSQAEAKEDNIEPVALNGETIALNAIHIPLLFPAESIPEKSRAETEIWFKCVEFKPTAENFQVQPESLRDAVRAKNAAGD